MRTGGAPWRAPARALALLTGALVTATAAVTGCGGTGTPETTRRAPEGAGASASPTATPPEDLCTRLVAHWSREILDGGTYGDYQSMGLSDRQYEIVRDVVDAARAEREREDARAARRLVDRTARERCEELYRDGTPGAGPWR
ncbi:hypothetical protein [Streptomyces beigongshangae]|uniref:hypothetical protein n=1 Tax=Streptomyces beigongshangae TaxID=2841597 RepID=UPI001C84D99C|nr:hypothetical protein [Streptomyces sp. REN17]